MHFIPTTPEEEVQLLNGAAVSNFSELIKIIPQKFRLTEDLGIGTPFSEMEIERMAPHRHHLEEPQQRQGRCRMGAFRRRC